MTIDKDVVKVELKEQEKALKDLETKEKVALEKLAEGEATKTTLDSLSRIRLDMEATKARIARLLSDKQTTVREDFLEMAHEHGKAKLELEQEAQRRKDAIKQAQAKLNEAEKALYAIESDRALARNRFNMDLNQIRKDVGYPRDTAAKLVKKYSL